MLPSNSTREIMRKLKTDEEVIKNKFVSDVVYLECRAWLRIRPNG